MEGKEELQPIAKETEDWHSKHPLLKAAKQGTGFICWHTQELKVEDLKKAIEGNGSIEIDISQWGPEVGKFPPKTLVARHHPWYHAFSKGKGQIPDYQTILTPEKALTKLEGNNVLVKFDLKSPDAIPWFLTNANRIAPELRMVHCFPAELQYSYRQETGYSASEYISLAELKKVRESLDNIPLQVSCRGVSLEDIQLRSGDSYPVVDRLCEPIKGLAEVINFHLIGGINPPPEIILYTWRKHNLMTEVNIDKDRPPPLGTPFLGRTDHLSLATKIA